MTMQEINEVTETVGEMVIKVYHVSDAQIASTADDGSQLLVGIAHVEYACKISGRDEKNDIYIKITCWADTDDDGAEWSATHEGAHIIAACLGVSTGGDMRGSPVWLAFPNESASLGRGVCQMLRDAVTATPNNG